MINEEKLIDELLNHYQVNNSGTWNEAIDEAILIVKGLPTEEKTSEEMYELPAEPIDCAVMLISATIERENSPVLRAIGGKKNLVLHIIRRMNCARSQNTCLCIAIMWAKNERFRNQKQLNVEIVKYHQKGYKVWWNGNKISE